MRIAYVSADRGVPIGGTKGASIHVRGVVNALADLGHSVTVLAASVEKALEGRRIETVDYGFDRTLKDLKHHVREFGGKTLAQEIHSLLLGSRLAERLAEVFARRPVDAIYERYSLFSYAGLRFARERGIPIGLEVNAPLVAEQASYRSLLLAPAASAIERYVIQKADVVFVPSEELRIWIEKECRRERRTVVVPNGVDTRLFNKARLRPVDDAQLKDRFVVAFVGSLKPWHGIDRLVAAFGRLREVVPNAHLLVIGEGPLRSEIERAADQLGEGHVTLTGAVPHEEVPRWLALADVAVAPYPDLDDFYFSPLKVVEYQAAGLPVVASRIGHITRQIEDGKTGLLVDPADEADLVRAIVRLHEDPELRRRLAKRARRHVKENGSWEAVAKRVVHSLERVGAQTQGSALAKEAK